jgi:tRNA(Ile)-lysidine synthase
VAVACSGGPDSLALLHATACAAQALGLQVWALHVHHGLMPEADAWARRLAAWCKRRAAAGLPLHFGLQRLAGAPAAGQSVEAWARQGRYRALADMARAQGITLVLLAHHRRDQAETVLWQALRGAGTTGLSAMPASVQRDGLTWARPWLAQPAEAVGAYLRAHRLRPLARDPSNTDPRYVRGRLRSTLWPALRAQFPDAEQALALAALRAQEADAALRDWVAQDLAAIGATPAALPVPGWRALPAPRRALALRQWLAGQGPGAAPQALVQRLLADLPQAANGCWPASQGWQCRLYRGRLSCEPTAQGGAAGPGQPLVLDLHQAGEQAVPAWGGVLCAQAVAQGGVAPALLRGCVLRARAPGDQFQRAPRTPPRALKKQFQAQGLPAWQRAAPVLALADGRLAFVPGLGVDARLWAPPGTPQLGLAWRAE